MMSKLGHARDLELGCRVEIEWDDAYYSDDLEAVDERRAIHCWDMGYWSKMTSKGVRLWRQIDEDGLFRWNLDVPTGVITKIRRLGPRPRGTQEPSQGSV